MKVYLVQHAKAASPEQDPSRALTEEGRRDMEKVADFVRPLHLSAGCIQHSGKKRAEQTAELLAAVVKTDATTARQGLGPNDDVLAIESELNSAEQDTMIVGHMPFLGRLASLLLTGSESAETVRFRNGGIVCLERNEQGRWQIDWVVTPQILG